MLCCCEKKMTLFIKLTCTSIQGQPISSEFPTKEDTSMRMRNEGRHKRFDYIEYLPLPIRYPTIEISRISSNLIAFSRYNE